MKILVINCGSSSLKYQLIDMDGEKLIAKGTYERIGEASFLTHKINGQKYVLQHPAKTHKEALDFAIQQLLNKDYPAISSLDEIGAIGHRTVHGGEYFKESVIIDDEVIKRIEECSSLAPVHNPCSLIGIRACQELMPGKPMVAVFDTAFHQTIPEERYIYPIPYKYYEKYKIRKYGFHGTSHYYVSHRIAEVLGKPIEDLKIVNCHLGQGASICAIQGGKSVETSMGLTPISGIPMCSRSGDLDPSIVTFLMKNENMTADDIDNMLNKDSGIWGICGVSKDVRDIEAAIDEGNEKAKLALEHYKYKIAEFIAKYAVAMQGIDVITFTAGVGENQVRVRKGICEYLKFMGVKIDDERNKVKSEEALISTDDSSIPVWVIPTNEELVIARDTLRLVTK
ncbi:acetate kinase [Clostridium sp. CAG:793]|jgi:acetate kinase|nr:acetate kinase [Clostridium sp. CAG:793]